MRGFTFRLEPLLSLRRHREQTLQLKLAESQRALERERSELQRLREEIRARSASLHQQQGRGPLDMGRVSMESAYLILLEGRVAEQEVLVEKLARQVDGDREAVLEAAKEKKALERLREVQLVAFARAEARKEMKAAEEVATTRHVRRSREQEEVALYDG